MTKKIIILAQSYPINDCTLFETKEYFAFILTIMPYTYYSINDTFQEKIHV